MLLNSNGCTTKRNVVIIAIDPGVNNGLAIYDTDRMGWFFTGEVPVWTLFFRIDELIQCEEDRLDMKLIIEDPRMISGSPGKAMGAGWVRVLAGQYEAFCKERGLRYELIRPNDSYLKKTPEFVELQTGIKTIKGHHNERDAIMLLYYYGLH
jgi:hypothetical protein